MKAISNDIKGSGMSHRWLAAVFVHCEKGFRTVKRFASIPAFEATIETEHKDQRKLKSAA